MFFVSLFTFCYYLFRAVVWIIVMLKFWLLGFLIGAISFGSILTETIHFVTAFFVLWCGWLFWLLGFLIGTLSFGSILTDVAEKPPIDSLFIYMNWSNRLSVMNCYSVLNYMNCVGCSVLLSKDNIKDIILFLIDSILNETKENYNVI